MVRRGLLIVLEGVDRSGKSTQSKLLVESLKANDIDVIGTHFPDRTTTIGKLINEYLAGDREVEDRVIHLLFSANRWERRSQIEAWLAAGTTIVCDRYTYSGVAFSCAKGLDLDWCTEPDRGLHRPDLVFFLDLPTDDASRRSEFGSERYEREDFQRKVAGQFHSLKEPTWHVLDARQSPGALAAIISDTVSQTMREAV